jgi:outer membrane protein, heavy metal efflux system
MVGRAVLFAALTGGCASRDGGPALFPTPVPSQLAANRSVPQPVSRFRQVDSPNQVQRVSFETPSAPAEVAQPAPATMDDFVRLAVERNPRLARANFAIDAARGRYVQAGLYPNPELAVSWDEIGDRTGNGIITAPKVTQTIVTGKKLTLAQIVAGREVDQATLDVVAERFAIVGSVRAAFYESLTIQRRAEILEELLKLADEAVANGKTLLNAERIARLDFIQLEVERERFRAELQSVKRELPGSYRRLAAVSGNPSAIPLSITGTFDGLPDYDVDAVRQAVLNFHPQVRSAQVGVERAQAAVRRAEAEPIPNVTAYAGFIRQNENRSNDAAAGVSLPVPLWNRNQGNIRAAKAELGMAIQAVGQTENELAARVAAAHQRYASARERAEVYRKELIPRAEETFKLSLTAFKGGQFEYLRVIQAQRAVSESRLEYNKSLGEAWQAAGELSGLLLEESWPGPMPGPGGTPMIRPPVLPPDRR